MTDSSGVRSGGRVADRPGARPYGILGVCLLTGLAGLAGGCGVGGGGRVAPVESLNESRTPERASEHVVVKGDTLYSIAWRHGLDYRALAQANAIREPFTILPGQRIRIPEPGSVAAPKEPAPSSDAPARTAGAAPEPEAKPLPSPEPVVRPLAKESSREAAEAARETPPKAPAQQPRTEPEQPASRRPAKQADAKRALRKAAGLRWMWPTEGKTVGRFAKSGGKGIDISGAFEQPIHAAAGGQIVYAGSGLIGYGKLVIVKHGDRLLSAYAHNARLHVKEGEPVRGGEHIADMGRSGKGRVMLHFEIRRDGKPVDPLRFLPR